MSKRKSSNTSKWLLALLGFSLLPIWRPAAGWEGQNLWEYLGTTVLVEKLEHTTVEEAIEDARRAYCKVMGLDYSKSYMNVGIGLPAGVIPAALLASMLPVYRSGLHEGITLPEWAYHHTKWGPRVTHIPEEKYLESFKQRYG